MLVTDGHVRAARFRLLAIPLVLIGVVFIILAAPPSGLFFYFPTPNLAGLGQDFQSRAAQPVMARFSQIPPLSLTSDQIKKLAPADQLGEVTKLILKSVFPIWNPLKGI